MNVLAFDTCFDACSVAAARGLRTLTPQIEVLFEPMAIGHAERLVPMIAEAMAATGLTFEALDRIVVTDGPGTFTGTRTGVSVARALALSAGCRLTSISSLRLMAESPRIVLDDATNRVMIAVDARRGEVYTQLFDRRRNFAPLSPPALLSLADAAALCREVSGRVVPVTIAGSGAEAVATAARNNGFEPMIVVPDLLPDAADILFRAFELGETAKVAPLYLRPPDAKPQDGKAIARI